MTGLRSRWPHWPLRWVADKWRIRAHRPIYADIRTHVCLCKSLYGFMTPCTRSNIQRPTSTVPINHYFAVGMTGVSEKLSDYRPHKGPFLLPTIPSIVSTNETDRNDETILLLLIGYRWFAAVKVAAASCSTFFYFAVLPPRSKISVIKTTERKNVRLGFTTLCKKVRGW